MILMAVPLMFLYVGGVLLCNLMPRRTTPFGEVIT
jgi:Sec-independent protein secretion pathway component TatC